MKKILLGFSFGALLIGSAFATTNKTFLLPRPHGVNLAMEYATWNELLQSYNKNRLGANLQATGFYMDSQKRDDLGKYFGVANKNAFILGGSGIATTAKDVQLNYIIHDTGDKYKDDKATIKFSPKQTSYGLRIDYYQDLEKFLKGLYFKINVPIVRVENDMQLNVSSATANAVDVKAKLINFFKGGTGVGVLTGNDTQGALGYIKMDGKKSETNLADLDFVVGYKFLDIKKYHMSINLGLTIPIDTDSDGVWLFEPMVGDGQHWAVGAGVDFGAELWKFEQHKIKVAFALNYRFLFESSEKRTIGLKETTQYPFGQYYLVGKIGQVGIYPAANIFTRDIDVEPGSQIDTILSLAYNYCGFSFDLGYNLYWKDSEDMHMDDGWTDGQYGIVLPNVASTKMIAATDFVGGAAIAGTDIDVEIASTPSYLTNKVYGGLGYVFKNWKYAPMIGVGAHYEFAYKRGAIENWGAWGKLGIAF